MIKKFVLLQLTLLVFMPLLAQEPDVLSKFNPEDTWMYRFAWWPESMYGDSPSAFYRVHKLEMKVVDEVEINNKLFYHLSWNVDGKYENIPSNGFYLREENGAYYNYFPQEYCDGYNKINPGEYLIYDFNMEVGKGYQVPFMTIDRSGGMGYLGHFYGSSGIAQLYVRKNYIDEFGRRVLELDCMDVSKPGSLTGLLPNSIKIVEGLGPMECGNIAMFIFPETHGCAERLPTVDFEASYYHDGEEKYVSDLDKKIGFIKERDYIWIYAEFDKYGNVGYRKMGFNYIVNSAPLEPTPFRRFGTLGIGNTPDGNWEKTDFKPCYVREEDGKVFLFHSENSLYWLSSAPRLESLIYDFGAPDGEELTFYSPRGEKTAKIATGLTEVGGEEMLSYTFEGSDGVKCVEGIGITKGGILPAVNTEFHGQAWTDESYVGCVLIAVYDGDGNLIFRQDLPSEIETVNADNGFVAPSDRLFDLQGRELREPMPGQPYIKGGKIFVETK